MASFVCLLLVSCFGFVLSSTLPPLKTLPSGCVYNGKMYTEGSFRPSPCEYCQCHNGRPMCAIADCMMPPCVDSVRPPDQCCATCPNGKTVMYSLSFLTHLCRMEYSILLNILLEP